MSYCCYCGENLVGKKTGPNSCPSKSSAGAKFCTYCGKRLTAWGECPDHQSNFWARIGWTTVRSILVAIAALLAAGTVLART